MKITISYNGDNGERAQKYLLFCGMEHIIQDIWNGHILDLVAAKDVVRFGRSCKLAYDITISYWKYMENKIRKRLKKDIEETINKFSLPDLRNITIKSDKSWFTREYITLVDSDKLRFCDVCKLYHTTRLYKCELCFKMCCKIRRDSGGSYMCYTCNVNTCDNCDSFIKEPNFRCMKCKKPYHNYCMTIKGAIYLCNDCSSEAFLLYVNSEHL